MLSKYCYFALNRDSYNECYLTALAECKLFFRFGIIFDNLFIICRDFTKIKKFNYGD